MYKGSSVQFAILAFPRCTETHLRHPAEKPQRQTRTGSDPQPRVLHQSMQKSYEYNQFKETMMGFIFILATDQIEDKFRILQLGSYFPIFLCQSDEWRRQFFSAAAYGRFKKLQYD